MGSGEIVVPILSYEDLRTRADGFLAEFHPLLEIPVPIEEIIEFQLNMNIIPLPGLRDLLDIDGFISGDLSTITVDEYIYNKVENRYRFTLAHEVGHFWLHQELYEGVGFSSLDEWKEFVTEIPEDKHNWLEYQAYSFAGLVLAPQEPLTKEASPVPDTFRLPPEFKIKQTVVNALRTAVPGEHHAKRRSEPFDALRLLRTGKEEPFGFGAKGVFRVKCEVKLVFCATERLSPGNPFL